MLELGEVGEMASLSGCQHLPAAPVNHEMVLTDTEDQL